MGLLSLMDDEETDSAKNFGWEEIRYEYPKTLTVACTSGAGIFAATVGGASITSAATLTVDTTYFLAVADEAYFQINDAVMVLNVPLNAGGTANIRGVVMSKDSSGTEELGIRILGNAAATYVITNTAAAVGLSVTKLGSAFAEGSRSGTGRMLVPVEPSNHTQIFKDAMEFTRTGLKIPTDFDKSGAYKTKAKTAVLDHMVGLEYAFMFGKKNSIATHVLAAGGAFGGSTVAQRTTGGVLHFLEEWEASGGGAAGYRPGGAALTADTDDLKRIIENSTGTMTRNKWDEYIWRVFRKANSQSREKLCFVGSKSARAVQQLIERRYVQHIPATESGFTFGMEVTTVKTSVGKVHFKDHPLFSEIPGLDSAMLFIDLPFLKYRALNDSDTIKLDNRQDNDEDGRKDIWMTEAGLELRFPEAFMFIKDVQKIL